YSPPSTRVNEKGAEDLRGTFLAAQILAPGVLHRYNGPVRRRRLQSAAFSGGPCDGRDSGEPAAPGGANRKAGAGEPQLAGAARETGKTKRGYSIRSVSHGLAAARGRFVA